VYVEHVYACVHVYVCALMFACVRARVHACVEACANVCACGWVGGSQVVYVRVHTHDVRVRTRESTYAHRYRSAIELEAGFKQRDERRGWQCVRMYIVSWCDERRGWQCVRMYIVSWCAHA